MNKIKSKPLGDNITQPSFHVTTYIRRWCVTFFSNREVLALSLRPKTAILTYFLLLPSRKMQEFYLILDKTHLLSLFYQIFFFNIYHVLTV